MDFKREVESKAITYAVTEAPAQVVRYSRTGIRFRPETVVVKIVSGELASVRVIGRRIRKDGTFSTTTHTNTYYSAHDVTPEWLDEIIRDVLR